MKLKFMAAVVLAGLASTAGAALPPYPAGVVRIDTINMQPRGGLERLGLTWADSWVVRLLDGVLELEEPSDKGGESFGSGWAFRDGYILTNHHVVDASAVVRVTLPDGRSVPASVVGSDPAKDVAVVKVAGQLPALPVAKQPAKVGDAVVCVGNSLGFNQTMQPGTVTAVRYQFGQRFIQSNALCTHGGSGGPVVNQAGEVVGMLAFGSGEAGGFSFSIPVDRVVKIANQLIAGGVSRYGHAGIEVHALDPAALAALGLRGGIVVASISAKGSAAKSGLQPGDVIVSANRQPMYDAGQLREVVEAGQPVRLDLLRNRRRMDLVLAPALVAGPRFKRADVPSVLVAKQSGGRVVLSSVAGRASLAGLAVGDVVLQVNQKPAKASELNVMTDKEKPVALLIERGGQRMLIGVN